MKCKKILLAVLTIGTTFFGTQNSNDINISNKAASYSWSGEQNSTEGNYYDSCTGLVGDELKAKLKTIISKNLNRSYAWSRYESADEAEGDSSSIFTIYSQQKFKKTAHVNSKGVGWSREHVFPQSKSGSSDVGDSDSDNHVIFASDNKVNNSRSNKRLGIVNGGTQVKDCYGKLTDNYTTSSLFEPTDAAKGKVARATMYAAVLYGYSITDNMTSVDLCLDWHEAHPVTNQDIYRNNIVYSNQHNRNPFVDHPEYADLIWGSKTISPSIRVDDLSCFINDSKQLTFKQYYSTSSISWNSSNASVCAIDQKGKITGISKGNSTITASFVESGKAYSDTCVVTINEPYIETPKDTIEVAIDDSKTIDLSTKGYDGAVSYKIADESICSYDPKTQVITGLKTGSTTIEFSFESNGKTYSKILTITIVAKQNVDDGSGSGEDENPGSNDKKPTISFYNPKNKLSLNETYQCIVNVTNSSSKITYKSSDEEILTVSDAGKIKALKAGKANIIASIDDNGTNYETSIEIEVYGKNNTNNINTGGIVGISLAGGLLVIAVGVFVFILIKKKHRV
ncbi:MAG: endonuclease [Erysipelotrichaceae bacterium]|nr:endonuclease [Erysipelotrichaceae bacterium]MCB9500237.1 endonuclease [Erysipelotrichaceae bacterium]